MLHHEQISPDCLTHRRLPAVGEEFVCANCAGTFINPTPPEEVEMRKVMRFGPLLSDDDCYLVCGHCLQEIIDRFCF